MNLFSEVNREKDYFEIYMLIPYFPKDAISITELKRMIQLPKSEIIKRINQARSEGIFILSKGSKYYLPVSDDQLKKYYKERTTQIKILIDEVNQIKKYLSEKDLIRDEGDSE